MEDRNSQFESVVRAAVTAAAKNPTLHLTDLLKRHQVEIEQTTHDNYDGGIWYYTVRVSIPLDRFIEFDASVLEGVENQLLQKLERVSRGFPGHQVFKVVLLAGVTTVPQLSSSDQLPTVWNKRPTGKVFISYSSEDSPACRRLADELKNLGMSPFLAHQDIEATREWRQEIIAAVGNAELFISYLTPNFKQSDWTNQEVGMAIAFDCSILTVRPSATVSPYGFMRPIQAITSSDPETIATKALDVLKSTLSPESFSNMIVNNFTQSESFAAAKRNVKTLGDLEHWDSELAKKIGQAFDNNNQLSGAYGVSAQIRAILSRAGFDGYIES